MIIPLILAAGAGTRMLPLSKVKAKPCLPLLNCPLIAYTLLFLKSIGFKRVGVNLFHLAESARAQIEFLCHRIEGLEPIFVEESYLSGSGGGVRALYNAFGEPDATYLVFNGDTIIQPNLKRFLQQHVQKKARLSILCSPNPTSTSVVVNFRSNPSRVVAIRSYGEVSEPGLTPCDFTGVQVISGELIEELPDGPCDIIDTLYASMLERDEPIHVVRHPGYWASIDSPELLLKVSKELITHRKAFAVPLPPPMGGRGGYYFCRPKLIHRCAEVVRPCLVGVDVSIDFGAQILRNSILDHVHLAPDASVKNAILYDMGLIEGKWHNCIAISGEVVRF